MGALRIADFRLLLCARTASQAGAWLMVVAIPVHVYALTGSAAATALAPAIESPRCSWARSPGCSPTAGTDAG